MSNPLASVRDTTLLLSAMGAVIGLIVLVARFKVNSFVALILASLFMGVFSGMKLLEIVTAFQAGVGKVLGSIAVVIGLGTILGKMLAESGGAEEIASRLTRWLGAKQSHWAMLFIAFIVGIPVFFAVGLVLLIPIVYTMVRQTNMPLLFAGLPLVAALSVVHGLVPPHPGPMVAIESLHANAGKTILYALLVGLPVAALAGPIFGRMLAAKLPLVTIGALGEQLTEHKSKVTSPGFGMTLLTILLPVFLMLLASLVDLLLTPENRWRQVIDFLGSPLTALLAAVLLSFYTFGARQGITRDQILHFSNDCLGPVASVLLVVGAGGGFNNVLVAGGVGQAIAGYITGSPLSPLILAWLAAALIRVATGSATVAITTAAGIMAPATIHMPGVNLELLVISMGAGSLILSHVNDGGFWLVKEYLNMTVTQTLQTWTVMETFISVAGLLLVLLLNLFL